MKNVRAEYKEECDISVGVFLKLKELILTYMSERGGGNPPPLVIRLTNATYHEC